MTDREFIVEIKRGGVVSMTDQEFYDEVRRGLLLIIRAMLRRYKLSWADFLPRDVPVLPAGWIEREPALPVVADR